MASSSTDSIEHAIEGDPQALQRLLEEHFKSLKAYVHRRLGAGIRSKESTMDLTQSICREAIEDFDAFEDRGPQSFRNWLFRRAENKIRDRGRYWNRDKRALNREISSHSMEMDAMSWVTPSRSAVAREELLRVEGALDRLPKDYRKVILLSRFAGLPHEIVAEKMGRSQLAMRSLLSRALARLALNLEKSGPRSEE